MMTSTFQRRITKLIEDVGTGNLLVRVTVDQPYAQDQHETLDYRHPGGGQAKYLESGLYDNHGKWLQQMADDLLRGRLESRAVKISEALSDEVFKRAPREFGDLRASGHPEVLSNRRSVYDRAPYMRRLTQADLNAKDDLRALGLGHDL